MIFHRGANDHSSNMISRILFDFDEKLYNLFFAISVTLFYPGFIYQ